MTAPGPLSGVRVLDLAGPIGWYATRLLADLGADVIRIEPPGGDPTRVLPPLLSENGMSAPWLWFNTGKRSIEADLESSSGQDLVRALAAEADVLVETFEPDTLRTLRLGYETLAAANPRLVYTAITPFGQTGPRANWRATDIVGVATGGLLHLSGCMESPPSHPGGDLGYMQAGIVGAAATLIALHGRSRTGRGQLVDVSMQDTMVFCNENALGIYDLMGQVRGRIGWRSFSGGRTFYMAKDGWVSFWLGGRWDAFVALADAWGVDTTEWRRPEWYDPIYRERHLTKINATIESMIAVRTKQEVADRSQELRVAAAAVNTIEDLLRDPQLSARGYWAGVDTGTDLAGDGVLRFPGAPFHLSKSPWRLRRPAPLPNQHAGEGWLPRQTDSEAAPATPTPKTDSAGPLAGVRVLDFTWQIAGPGAVQVLADHGADILKIESAIHPDGLRIMTIPRPVWTTSINQSGIYAVHNTSKRSVSLKLSEEQGREILKQLIKLCDVMVDNYGVDPFPKWGLTEADIRAINPDIVIARSSVMGRSGPHSARIGFGFTIGPNAGLNSMTGFPGDAPVGTCTAHPDYSCNSYHFLIAMLAALRHREQTGEGQTIDLSQHESTVAFNGPAVPLHAATGQLPAQSANRHPAIAPHGVYPCRGSDRWVAIACEHDADWPVLARAIGRDDLAENPVYASLGGRRASHELLDHAISAWTRRHSPAEAMALLQEEGVAAGAVQRADDLFRDEQLRFRGKLGRVQHPEMGLITLNAPSFLLSERGGSIRKHPPLIGQHTEDVLRDLVGFDEEAMADAYIAGVLE